MTSIEVPIWEKEYLTIAEARAYFNIGRDKLYQLAKEHDEFILHKGRKILYKRRDFKEYLEQVSYI